MKLPASKQVERYLKVIIVLASIVLIALFILLIREYKNLRRLNYISSRQSWLLALRAHKPATASDVVSIQGWMTFDYINNLFVIPPEYLKTNLSITDTRYPRLTIGRYAKDKNISQAESLSNVQNAVRTYLGVKP